MTSSQVLPANFTISAEAKRAIEKLRNDNDAATPDDPAAVVCIAWGLFVSDAGARSENVVVGFYPQSMLADVAHGLQDVSGVTLVFFVSQELHGHFSGKVLDHNDRRGFFLREP